MIQKPTQIPNCHQKKMYIKIECIGFWEHIVRYQRTLMFPIFCFILSTLNCLFAMNWNPAGLLYATNGCVSSSDPNGRAPSKSPLISQELTQECPALLLIPHYNTAMQCALNTARCTLNNAQCTMHMELSILNNAYCALNTEQDALHTEHCSVHWTMKCAVTSHLPLLPHPTSLPI